MAKDKLPRPIKSLKEFYELTDKGLIDVEIRLGHGLKSSHVFQNYKNKINDYSLVDDSETDWSYEDFENGIYVEAIKQKAMIVETISFK